MSQLRGWRCCGHPVRGQECCLPPHTCRPAPQDKPSGPSVNCAKTGKPWSNGHICAPSPPAAPFPPHWTPPPTQALLPPGPCSTLDTSACKPTPHPPGQATPPHLPLAPYSLPDPADQVRAPRHRCGSEPAVPCPPPPLLRAQALAPCLARGGCSV